jgi:lipoprotein-anchoring transpeptidase ErfK/SrfK
MMKRIVYLLAGLLLALSLTGRPAMAHAADPAVKIVIDVSTQSMAVEVNGWPWARWAVSTAREGYHTPRGTFRPTMLMKVYYSKKYDNSPMPNSIFFHYGFAIHGTYYQRYLGRPASHGCVRLAPDHAAQLYSLVQKYGFKSTRISIVD